MQQMITNPPIVTWKILNLDGRAPCTIMLTAEIIIRQNDVFKGPENYVFANSWVLLQRKCNDDFDQV